MGSLVTGDQAKALALSALKGAANLSEEVAIQMADLLHVSVGFVADAANLADMIGGIPFLKVRDPPLRRACAPRAPTGIGMPVCRSSHPW